MNFGFGTLVARCFEAIYFNADSLIVGNIAGTASLGYYNRARYISELGHLATAQATVQVAFPVYCQYQEDLGRLAAISETIHFFSIRLMGFLFLVLIIAPSQLVGLLYGATWLDTAGILPGFAVYTLLVPAVENMKVLLTAMGRLSEAAKIRLWQVSFALPGILVGLKFFGISGAAMGMSLGMIAGLIGGHYYLYACGIGGYSSILRTYARPVVCMTFITVGWGVLGNLSGSVSFYMLKYQLALLPLTYALCLALVDREPILRRVSQALSLVTGRQAADFTSELRRDP
jgi:PST family polysaccharide transporter